GARGHVAAEERDHLARIATRQPGEKLLQLRADPADGGERDLESGHEVVRLGGGVDAHARCGAELHRASDAGPTGPALRGLPLPASKIGSPTPTQKRR